MDLDVYVKVYRWTFPFSPTDEFASPYTLYRFGQTRIEKEGGSPEPLLPMPPYMSEQLIQNLRFLR